MGCGWVSGHLCRVGDGVASHTGSQGTPADVVLAAYGLPTSGSELWASFSVGLQAMVPVVTDQMILLGNALWNGFIVSGFVSSVNGATVGC